MPAATPSPDRIVRYTSAEFCGAVKYRDALARVKAEPDYVLIDKDVGRVATRIINLPRSRSYQSIEDLGASFKKAVSTLGRSRPSQMNSLIELAITSGVYHDMQSHHIHRAMGFHGTLANPKEVGRAVQKLVHAANKCVRAVHPGAAVFLTQGCSYTPHYQIAAGPIPLILIRANPAGPAGSSQVPPKPVS